MLQELAIDLSKISGNATPNTAPLSKDSSSIFSEGVGMFTNPQNFSSLND